jgi:hypothetical protein
MIKTVNKRFDSIDLEKQESQVLENFLVVDRIFLEAINL